MSSIRDRRLVAVDRTRLTDVSSSTPIPAPPNSGIALNKIECCTIQARTQAIYYTEDGVAATSTIGKDGAVGTVITIEDPSNCRILEAAASASVEVTYYARAGTTT